MSDQQVFRQKVALHLVIIIFFVPFSFLFYDFALTHRQSKTSPAIKHVFSLGKGVHLIQMLSDRHDRYLIASVRSHHGWGLYVIALHEGSGKVIQRIRLSYVHSMALSKDEKTLYVTNNAKLYIFNSSDFTDLKLIGTYTLDNDSKIHPFRTRLLESPQIYYSTIGWTNTLSLSRDKRTLYVAGPKGLFLFDVARPRNIRLLGHLDDRSYYNVQAIDRNHLLVTAFRTVDVLDVSKPNHPIRLSSHRLPYPQPNCLALTGLRAVVSFGYTPNLTSITIDNRYRLHHVSDFPADSAKYIHQLSFAEKGQILLAQSRKLYVFDIRYPLDPKKVATFSCQGDKNPAESSFYNAYSQTLYMGCFNSTVSMIRPVRFPMVFRP